MAILTVNQVPAAGITDSDALMTAAAGGGDSFANTGREIAEFNNASGGTITITASSNGAGAACNFGVTATAHDKTLAIPAGKRGRFAPLPANRFNDANGRVQLTYSGVTSLTVGIFSTAAS